MVQFCIRMLRIPFEKFEIGFESLESLSNDSNLESIASNPFQMVQIFNSNGSNPFEMVRMWLRKLRIPFEWFEFAFENFEYLSNGSILHSNTSKPFQIV